MGVNYLPWLRKSALTQAKYASLGVGFLCVFLFLFFVLITHFFKVYYMKYEHFKKIFCCNIQKEKLLFSII